MRRRTVIVIGAGIGGLTAATHLAHAGFQVTVLEKNEQPGGRCGRLARAGHVFDTGPTLMVMPLLYETEFQALGASMHERLDLRRVDPTYHLVFDDGSQLALTSDAAAMREQLEAIERGSFIGLQRYLEKGGRNYDLVLENLVTKDFRRASDFFNLRSLSLFFQLQPLVNHYRNMARYFDAPRLKSAFTFQDLYTGLSPFEAPATFSMLPYSEMAHGVWHPRGGMYSIVEALVRIATDAGVAFAFRAPVSRIDIDGDSARGVILADGSELRADVVLANADLPYVYQRLLPRERRAGSLMRKRFSCSAISFLWGLDTRYQQLGPHTLFLADDYRRNFDEIMRDLTLPTNPGVYVHAPARLDPSMAPAGHDTLTAIVPVGHLGERGDRDWAELRDEARQHVFRRLRSAGVPNVEAHIKFEESFTPISWADRYNLAKGSTHGLSHRLTQMAYFRPSNRHGRYRNVYFAGASTHPGTGVPIAMVSGRLVADRIGSELT